MKHNKSKNAVFVLLLILVFSIIVYKVLIVRTVDSNNGWKHQVGHVGTCITCDKKATHRMKGPLFTAAYCDKHWDADGASLFEYLAYEGFETESETTSEGEDNAKICAEKAIKDKLKAPSTAKFCSFKDMSATYLGDNRWKISGYVDAENSFGAMIRQNWTVTLTLTDTGFTDSIVKLTE